MNAQPLTHEQQIFAENNHNIVDSFMRFKRLGQDYYDIIVFGYLRAVRKYFERPELRQYRFITIAYAAMNTDLINHYRKRSRLKRTAYIVSLDMPVYCDDENLTLMDIIPVADTAADNMAYDSLLDEISTALSQDQFSVFRMKSDGYSEREIAKSRAVPVRSVQEMLANIREILYPSLV